MLPAFALIAVRQLLRCECYLPSAMGYISQPDICAYERLGHLLRREFAENHFIHQAEGCTLLDLAGMKRRSCNVKSRISCNLN